MRKLTDYRREYLALTITETRRRIKKRAVEYKGGRCSRCGYNKCLASFEFHHLDPSQKDFSIAGHCKSFDRIKAELDKTILLCSNCHRELHDEEDLRTLESRKAELKKRAPPRGRPTTSG